MTSPSAIITDDPAYERELLLKTLDELAQTLPVAGYKRYDYSGNNPALVKARAVVNTLKKQDSRRKAS